MSSHDLQSMPAAIAKGLKATRTLSAKRPKNSAAETSKASPCLLKLSHHSCFDGGVAIPSGGSEA